jgi:oligopeptide transport system permease protein
MTEHTPSAVEALAIAEFEVNRPPKSLGQEAWERLLRNRASVIGLVVVIIFGLVALFANVLSPHNPVQINSGKSFLPPVFVTNPPTAKMADPSFPLGTDTLGRDLLSRVIYGARVSMLVGFIPTIVVVLIGTVIGMAAGFYGGSVDNFLMRLTDVVYGFPDLLFFITILVALQDTGIGDIMNGLFLLFVALALVNWVGVARVVRGQVLSLKEKEFIEAARCIGAKNSRIMLRHLLPNALSPLIVITAFRVPGAIITEAILGYLGLGMKPATSGTDVFITSWGTLLLEGQSAINVQPWILLTPAICVAIVVLAFTFLGDGLRDALDPRMRGTN